MHKSFNDLRVDLSVVAKLVKVGGIYKHYKDPESRYKVVGFTIFESSDEVAVRYVSLEADHIEFSRPFSEWSDKIDGVSRFSLINRGE